MQGSGFLSLVSISERLLLHKGGARCGYTVPSAAAYCNAGKGLFSLRPGHSMALVTYGEA